MTIFVEDKLKPGLIGLKLADAIDIALDAAGFDGNLSTSVVDVQLLAQAVDELVLSGGSDTAAEIRDKLHTLRVRLDWQLAHYIEHLII